jgi:hypothetical protein
MGSRIALFVLVVTPVAIASCALAVDLGGLAGPAQDSGVATDGGPATNADGALPPSDAGLDAGPDAKHDTAPFCTSMTHTFCADFDEGVIGANFTGTNTDPKGTLTVSSSASVSSPMALHATMARRAAGDLEYATALARIAGAWRTTVVEFDMLPEASSWQTNDINFALFEFDFVNAAAKPAEFYFVRAEKYAQLTGPGFSVNVDPLTVGVWTHVKLTFQPSGAFKATVAGKEYTAVGTALTGPGTNVDVTLGIIGYNAPVPALSMFYDNLTIDLL